MDIFVILFIAVGFGSVITGYLLEGGAMSGLFSLASLLIILGGTVGAVGVSFPKDELKQIPKILKIFFINEKRDYIALIDKMKVMCIQVRQSGLLTLEGQIEYEDDSLMRKGMRLIIDGAASANTRKALELSLEVMSERHLARANIFEAAGGFSPTMGIIGTVMGLVSVLSDLQDPESLGPKIAMAFIATLYGIGLANLVWLPIANNLKEKNRREILYKTMIIEGLLLIQEGVNSNFIEEKLSGFLTDSQLLDRNL